MGMDAPRGKVGTHHRAGTDKPAGGADDNSQPAVTGAPTERNGCGRGKANETETAEQSCQQLNPHFLPFSLPPFLLPFLHLPSSLVHINPSPSFFPFQT